MTDAQLVQALEEQHHSCFAWALACCRWNRDEAEEVLQSTYLKVLEGRARLNGGAIPRVWIFGVIRLTSCEHRRRGLARILGLERWRRLKPEPASPSTPEDDSADMHSHFRLRHLLERLSPRQGRLLHLVFYQEMTIEEASVVMGISLGSARTHYERGKARLRMLMVKEASR